MSALSVRTPQTERLYSPTPRERARVPTVSASGPSAGSVQHRWTPVSENRRFCNRRRRWPTPLDGRVAPSSIGNPQTAQMSQISSAGHEAGENLLVERGLPVAHQALRRLSDLHEACRHHHVAKAQSAAERFGERADIDRALQPIDRRDCRDWRAFENDIAVVIVLHDQSAILCAVPDQCVPSLKAHYDARGELMRPRDEGQLSPIPRSNAGSSPS